MLGHLIAPYKVKLPTGYEIENPPEYFPAGTMIFAAGEPGHVMYVVMSGEVEILVADQIVETVGPEGIFGEMALIDNEPRSAAARTKTECELLPVTEEQLMFMVRKTPGFSLEVMRVISRRLRPKNRVM